MLWKTKQELLESLEKIIEVKRRITTAEEKKKRLKNLDLLIVELFILINKSILLADRLLLIHQSNTTYYCFTGVASFYSAFFSEYLPKLSEDGNKQWDSLIQQTGYLEQLKFLSDFFSGRGISNDIFLKELRENVEEERKNKAKTKKTTEFELEIKEEELANMTLEDAILVLQKFERVYQAVCRRSYLRDAYQKAMNNRSGMELKISEEDAVIKIQARTRGFFARKKVNEMRRKEMDILGISMEKMLKMEVAVRAKSCAAPLPVHLYIRPQSIEAIVDSLKSNFFVSIDSEISKNIVSNEIVINEDAYKNLYIKGFICVPEVVNERIKDLISYRSKVLFSNKSLEFDICSFIYGAFIIPNILKSCEFDRIKRWMLIVGTEKSGKSSWVNAMCYEIGAIHIQLNKDNINKGRKGLLRNIMRLVRSNESVVVSIDQLQMFKITTKTLSTNKGFIRELLHRLSNTRTTVIGQSTSNDLDKEIRQMFYYEIDIGMPDNCSKFDLIKNCLSRCLEENKLTKVPSRMLDLQRPIKSKNAGESVKYIQSKWRH